MVVVHRIVKLPVTCNACTLSDTHRGMTHLHPQIVRDDRMLPATRWAALIVFFILVPAAAILWVAPDRTGDLWAWMIQPELTPIFLVATALLLIGAMRAFGDFDTDNPMTWLYLGGLLGTAGALALLHRRMEAPISREQPPSRTAPQHVGA